MDPYAEILVEEVGIKSRSKKEVYDLLVTEGGLYLPPISDWHHKFISMVMVGDKKWLKSNNVKVCSVPHLDGLKISQIIEFSRQHVNIEAYLPDYEYSKYPNRDWLWNVVNSLLDKKFQEFIQNKIWEHTKKMVMKKKLSIKALPEFVDIFKLSKNISVQKGRSHYLLKKFGKRKWDEIESDDKEKLKESYKQIENLNNKIERLKHKLDGYYQKEGEYYKSKEILAKLYDQNIVDSEGDLVE